MSLFRLKKKKKKSIVSMVASAFSMMGRDDLYLNTVS